MQLYRTFYILHLYLLLFVTISNLDISAVEKFSLFYFLQLVWLVPLLIGSAKFADRNFADQNFADHFKKFADRKYAECGPL